MSQKYARGGVTVAIGQSHEVSLPPGIFRGRATCMHFDTNMCFLLPPSMTGMRNIVAFAKRHPGAAMLVNGHTDLVGDAPSNLLLSKERAASVTAFLLQQVDAWLAWYQSGDPGKRWSYREDQNMLATVVDGSNAPYYAGAITGANDAATQDAARRFQQDKGLAADGQLGPDTRRALVTAYMALEGTSLPASTPVQQHGCGKSHPIDPTAAADQGNRRVEIFLFDGDVDPPPQATCPPGGCAEYAQWIADPEEDIDLCTACADLLVIVQDEADPPNRIADAQVTIDRPGTGVQTTGADGTTTFTNVSPGPVHVTAVYGKTTKETDATIEAGVQPKPAAYQKASFAQSDEQPAPGGVTNVAVVKITPRLRVSIFDFNSSFLKGFTWHIGVKTGLDWDTALLDKVQDARIDDYSLVNVVRFNGADANNDPKPPDWTDIAPRGDANYRELYLQDLRAHLKKRKCQLFIGYVAVDRLKTVGNAELAAWLKVATTAQVEKHAADLATFFSSRSITVDGIGLDIEVNGLGGGNTNANVTAFVAALAKSFTVVYYDTGPFAPTDGTGSTNSIAPFTYAVANGGANAIARPMCYEEKKAVDRARIQATIPVALGVSTSTPKGAHLQLAIDTGHTSDAVIIDMCKKDFRPNGVGITLYTMPKLDTHQGAWLDRAKKIADALNPPGTPDPAASGQPVQVPNP